MTTRAIMQRIAPVMVVLSLLTGLTSLAQAQTAEVHHLTVITSPQQSGCSGDDATLATLDLRKWDAHTFFWVGAVMSLENLSLAFCDSAGQSLVSTGDGASIMRTGLTLNAEVDGFIALQDLDGVTVRLNSPDTLLPGDYVMRHWSFPRRVEERLFQFPAGYTLVTACGNETGDGNGVAVELFAGEVNEFAGNSRVDHLVICERSGLSYVSPVIPPEAPRQDNGIVHVFHARGPDAAAAQATDAGGSDGSGQASDSPAFTVTSFTPGNVRYPVEGEPEQAPDERPGREPQAQTDARITTGRHFATLGTLARLFHVTLLDGTDAVDIREINADGSTTQLLRVDQGQVDAVDSGLIFATADNRLAVSVSSLDIITFAMGPDDAGRVHYLEMDEGLAGPVSATSSRRASPPGEAWS